VLNDVIWRAGSVTACLLVAISCTAPSQSNDKPVSDKAVGDQVTGSALDQKPDARFAETAVNGAPTSPAFWLSRPASQGALLIGQVPNGTASLRFDGQDVRVESDGFFVIGFDRDAGPNSKLVATLRDGRTVLQNVPVTPFKWALSYVNTPATGGAKSEAELAARRPGELKQIGAARAKLTNATGWRQDMIWPLKYWALPGGRVSGLFGRQRFYQGKPGSPHGGLDIAAATGTPFVAPADGVVILAAKNTPFTLEGHLLIIDHGNGLNSAFLHCSQLLVEVGQFVKQGQVIGKVGATGRAEGAHLHWGLRWRDARVDPLRLVPKAPIAKLMSKSSPK
jgi:murein DD-endopeptidase MepM/ murein hydrolase activator NlpD